MTGGAGGVRQVRPGRRQEPLQHLRPRLPARPGRRGQAGHLSSVIISIHCLYTIYTLSTYHLHIIYYLHNLNCLRCCHPRQLPLGLPRSIPSLDYDPRPRGGGQEAGHIGHLLPRLRRGRQPPLRVHSDPGRRRTGLLETRNLNFRQRFDPSMNYSFYHLN